MKKTHNLITASLGNGTKSSPHQLASHLIFNEDFHPTFKTLCFYLNIMFVCGSLKEKYFFINIQHFTD